MLDMRKAWLYICFKTNQTPGQTQMSIPCRVTQETNEHYDRQEAVAGDVELVRAERFREDRAQVRANAALLLAKQDVHGKVTSWRGDVYLGSRDCKWDYLDVVGRASEDDTYFGHMIDLTADDFTTKLTAAKKLAEIVRKAALAVAFDSLDITDIWVDVDHLLDWEPEQ